MVRLAIAFLFAGIASANAVVITFDWPGAPGWTAGAPTAGQTKTQVFTGFNPNDLTVAINNSGAGAQGMVFNGGYPQISTSPVTGGAGVNGLQLFASSSQVFGAYVQVTISFATPVTNLSFSLWDVDKGGSYVDKIANIQALAVGGGIVGADSVTSAVSGFNSITGTGLSTVVLGTATASNSSNQGTIDITFNQQITGFSFQWSNNDPALGSQGIGLGSLIYTPIPEGDPRWISGMIAAAVIAVEYGRRRKLCAYQ